MDGYPVRQQYVSDTPVQLLARPVGALLSVSAGAVTLLDGLGVKSVFDLGASMLFGTARAIVEAAWGVQSMRAMAVSRDMIDSTVADLTLAELADQPLTALRIVDAQLGQAMATAFGTVTVRELAAWPPYRAARRIFNDAYGFANHLPDDPERPAELVPTARQYATERVQYDVLVLDHVLEPVDEDEQPRPPLTMIPNWNDGGDTFGNDLDDVLLFEKSFDIRNAGGIDVADIVAATLMAQPAVGAILTYRQSWFQQGLALGQLLHSLALAPGESTRIALVDWTRRVRASSDEVTEQLEALSASVERNRSISEVTSAVAREAQQGFSEISSSATAEQSAQTAGSAGIGVAKPGILGALKEAVFGSDRSDIGVRSSGTSSATSTNTGWASSRASSSGERTLTGEMMQNVADRTQQAANSTRNRRATAVTESSQSESEKLSTRVVTNYNHMHALSVLYFEVVQVYRVVLEVARATPALFLPMKLVTFNETVIRRYRSVIAAAGLTPEVRSLAVARAGQLAIAAPRRLLWSRAFLTEVSKTLGFQVGNPADAVINLPLSDLKLFQVGSSDEAFFENFSGVAVTMANGARSVIPIIDRKEAHNGWTGQFGAGLPQVDAREIARIDLIQKKGEFEGVIELLLSFDGRQPDGKQWSEVLDTVAMAVSVSIECRKEKVTPAFVMTPAIGNSDLIAHLEENALHYSSAIWRSLDAAAITTLLGTYRLGGQRLIEVIDPVPAAVSGNYLVFRFYGDLGTDAWEALQEKLGEDATPREDMVPLPSGGVFAEAVLGRSNAAEKLDITRFWNWQDSPIPILPSEISPLSAGGKANDKTPQTGALEGSIVNIVNPPSLPDPAGLGPLYSAVANGGMFRDMSGLAQTTALVGAALQAAQAGAANATGAAGEAQRVAAQQLTEVLKIAAQVALAAMTGGGSAGLSAIGAIGGAAAGGAPAKPGVANTPSNAGALINHGAAMDARPQSGSPAPGGGGSTPAPGGGAAPRGGSGSGGQTTSREAQAADVALTGSGGAGGPYSLLNKAIQDTILTAAPSPVSASPPPADRWCCALMFNDAIEPASVTGHRYNSSSTSNCGYVYTEKAGLIDIGHIRDHVDLTKHVYDEIEKEVPVIRCREGVARLLSSPSDKVQLAEAIAFVDSWAHELRTYEAKDDFSSFSPEDMVSNFLGTYIGGMALKGGGAASVPAFNAIVDTLLAGLLADLGAQSAADTEAAIASKKGTGKWFDSFPPRLLRRNFEVVPWPAGMPYDKSPAPAYISLARLTPQFAEFEFDLKEPLYDGSRPALADFPAATAKIRAPFAAAGTDKP